MHDEKDRSATLNVEFSGYIDFGVIKCAAFDKVKNITVLFIVNIWAHYVSGKLETRWHNGYILITTINQFN